MRVRAIVGTILSVGVEGGPLSGFGCSPLQVPGGRFRVSGAGFQVPGFMSQVPYPGFPGFMFRVSCPGCHVPGLRFRVSGPRFRDPGCRSRVSFPGFHVPGSCFRFQVSGSGFQVPGVRGGHGQVGRPKSWAFSREAGLVFKGGGGSPGRS